MKFPLFKKKSIDNAAMEMAFSFLTKLFRNSARNSYNAPISRSAQQHAARDLIYASINERAKKVAASNLVVYQKTNQRSLQPLPYDHWAVELLSNPNPEIDAATMFMMMSVSLDRTGNMYFYTPKSKLGYPVVMWPLPSQRVSVIMNKEQGGGIIAGYEMRMNGISSRFLPDEILHIKLLDLSEDIQSLFVGKSPIEAIIDNADVDYEITSYIKRWFANDLNKKVILESPNEMDVTQWELFKQKWNEANPRMMLSGLLENGLKMSAQNANELHVSFESLDQRTTKIITAVFGLTLGLLTGDFTNRATAEIQEGRFLTNTINPLLTIYEQAFTRHLQKFDKSLVAEFDKWQFNDSEDKRKQEDHDVKLGIRTINDIRKERGQPPTEYGNEPLIMSGLVPISTIYTTAQTGTTPTVSLSSKKKALTSTPSEEDLTAFWRSYDERNIETSDKLKTAVSKVFEDIEDELTSSLKSYSQKDAETFTNILNLFDAEKWINALTKATGGILEEHVLVSIVESLRDVDLTSDDLPSDFSNTIGEILQGSTSKITDSIGTIKEELQKIIESNPLASSDELFDVLKKKFETLKESRARTIANTSSNYATGAAQTNTWKVVGFKVAWLSQRDGNVRSTHFSADGQVRGEDGLFDVGSDKMPHPCAGSIAEENVNCRCTCMPIKP